MIIKVLKQYRNHLVVFALALFGIAACAGPSEQMQLYDASMRSYEQALRWQDFDVVASFHKNEYKKITKQMRTHFRKFKVTSYNVVSNIMNPDQRHANQIIEIKYYNTDYQVVHEMTLQNRWEFDPKSNHWYLLNPLPDFK